MAWGFDITFPKANKKHNCFFCGLPIREGKRYKRVSWFSHDEGKYKYYKMHLECEDRYEELNQIEEDKLFIINETLSRHRSMNKAI